MAPQKKHRLESVKIPIELNEKFVEARDALGHTHTQAVEEAIEMYVRRAKRSTSGPSASRKTDH
jgi:predicted DNA-binding protein